MYMGAIATLKLQASTGNDSGDTQAQATVDLQKYFVNPGKRQMLATLNTVLTSTDSGIFDYKLQHASTTVDSDFSDISGGGFTQVGSSATPAPESILFFTNKRYIRGHMTVTAGASWAVACNVYAVKRDA